MGSSSQGVSAFNTQKPQQPVNCGAGNVSAIDKLECLSLFPWEELVQIGTDKQKYGERN